MDCVTIYDRKTQDLRVTHSFYTKFDSQETIKVLHYTFYIQTMQGALCTSTKGIRRYYALC